MLFFTVLLCIIVSGTLGEYGVDVSQPTSTDSFQCLVSMY